MEAWDLKTSDERTADGLALYLIFCEDSVFEVQYFRTFQANTDTKINVIGKFFNKNKQVMKVIHHCVRENYMTNKDGVLYLDRDKARVWCVYDNDILRQNNPLEEQIEFRVSVDTAIHYGLAVAWSNDAFELWILLHFKEVDLNSGLLTRSHYYDSLTEVFLNLEYKSEELLECLVIADFNYEKHLKRRVEFMSIVLPLLKQNTSLAIERARILYNQHLESGRYSCDEQNPATKIFELVEELLKISSQV